GRSHIGKTWPELPPDHPNPTGCALVRINLTAPQQVVKVRRIVEELGCEVATPDEAREILDLKGSEKVGF
ncbi:hypothetical protein ABID16_004476, partial [Rhizobium aquaticum]